MVQTAKVGLIFSLVIWFTLQVHAQGWDVGLAAGVATPASDVGNTTYGGVRSLRPLTGIGLGYAAGHWSARGQLVLGRLADQDLYYDGDPYLAARQFSFYTPFVNLGLRGEYRPLAPAARWQPHLAAGAGLLFYRPTTELDLNTWPELAGPIRDDRAAAVPNGTPLFTLAAGLGYRINDRLHLQLELQANWLRTDYLDGISLAGDPRDRDGYGAVMLGARYRLRATDSDGDGVADRLDACPLQPGPAELLGCPDSDGDGIRDSYDRCPLAAGPETFGGCPDTDGDGVPDYEDACPDVAGPRERQGCPAIDTDGDGLLDEDDACPEVAGPMDRRGCPAIDTDGDGLLDEDDECPEQFGLVIFNGCPDTDGDGIPDREDACPDVFGVFAQGGCPEAQDPEREARLLHMQILTFPPNSATLTRFALLDKVAQFLEQNPAYHLLLRGHSDAGGTENDRPDWSTLRTRAVYNYLLERGVPARQLHQEGLGNRYPLTRSESAGAREQNRRVEFWLYPEGERPPNPQGGGGEE